MRGDEVSLGTPHEDVASMAAVHEFAVEQKSLVCLGFGVAGYHMANPLMPVYWCFELAAVAERLLYRNDLVTTTTYDDIRHVIGEFRSRCAAARAIRPRTDIPV